MLTNEDEFIEEEVIDEETREESEVEQETDTDGLDLETDETETDEAGDDEDPEKSDDDEVIVTIGDAEIKEPGEGNNPSLVKHLRKQIRERNRELAELRKQTAGKPTETQPVVVGEKPTLAKHDYDTTAYEKDLAEWYERKRKADAQAAEAEREQEAQQKEHQGRLESYAKAKAALKVPDFDEAEEAVTEVLDVTQQGIILHAAQDPALLVYAIGKNSKEAKKLAAIKDPLKFAFALAKVEGALKVRKRKDKPAPERKLKSGNTSGVVDSKLEALREEAARTGDMSKVVAYKRNLKKKRS